MNYTINSENLSVTVSTKGGEMQSIRTNDGTEYLWQGDPDTWPDRALNLFPYVGRLNDKTYQYQGRKYSLDIHGFLPYEEMELLQQTPTHLTFCITDTEELRKCYPFRFEYLLHYAIDGYKISVTSEIRNQDEKTMYFGIGGHPGFCVPLEQNLRFEDYILEFGKTCHPKRVIFSEKCFVTDEKKSFPLQNDICLPLSHDMFDDDVIVLQNMEREVTLKSPLGTRGVKVCFPQMEYLGLWHWPKTAVNYVCIEPWSSLSARVDVIEDLETQEDLLSLNAGETYRNTWTITIIE